jgi:hypothetical protein
MPADQKPQPELLMRKFLGAFAIVAWLVAYVAVVAVVGDRVLKEHLVVQLIFFPIAGLAWVLPLKPLLKWMHAKDEPKESPDV